MEIPVYVITGFLESGKTSFIQDTLQSEEFDDGQESLLFVCEEGIEEYDEEVMRACHTKVVMIEEEEQITTQFLQKYSEMYHPERVLIEYNGVWKLQDLLSMPFPKDWLIVQVITLVNAETFELYLSNMRSIIMEQFTNTDMVIFNRCVEQTNRASYRRNVKAVNGGAQIYFESSDGSSNDFEEILPFDIEADPIEIEEEDFGIWYIDAMDEPKKYIGKRVKFKGLVYKPAKMKKGVFVPGRFAMTCCADDTAFIGFICKSDAAHLEEVEQLQNKKWVTVTASVAYEFQKEYRRKGPTLYLETLEKAEKARQDFVYFN